MKRSGSIPEAGLRLTVRSLMRSASAQLAVRLRTRGNGGNRAVADDRRLVRDRLRLLRRPCRPGAHRGRRVYASGCRIQASAAVSRPRRHRVQPEQYCGHSANDRSSRSRSLDHGHGRARDLDPSNPTGSALPRLAKPCSVAEAPELSGQVDPGDSRARLAHAAVLGDDLR